MPVIFGAHECREIRAPAQSLVPGGVWSHFVHPAVGHLIIGKELGKVDTVLNILIVFNMTRRRWQLKKIFVTRVSYLDRTNALQLRYYASFS